MTDIIEPGGGDPAPEPAAAPDRLPTAGQLIVAQRAITAPATVDRAAHTVEVVWSTGARARNFVPALGLITEELEMSPNAVRMDALRSGRAPVLDTHRRGGARDVLGRVVAARLERGRGYATLQFSTAADVEPVWQRIADGTLRAVSVGYRVHRYEPRPDAATGETVHRAVDWEPFEISVVPVPVDRDASVRGEAPQGAPAIAIEPALPDEDPPMPETTPAPQAEPAAPPAPPTHPPQETPVTTTLSPAPSAPAPEPTRAAPDLDAVRAEAQRAERERIAGIDAAVDAARAVLPAERATPIRAEAIAQGWTGDQARRALFDALVAQGPRPSIPARPETGPGHDDPAQILDAMAEALAARAMPGYQPQGSGRHAEFMGWRPSDMIGELLRARGVRSVPRNPTLLAERAFHTSSDFPLLLAAAANKMLLAAYQPAQPTYRQIFLRRDFRDFKPHRHLRIGDFPTLLPLAENGEIQVGTMSESQEIVLLQTFARRIRVTRPMLVNDDLGAFTDFAAAIGRRVAEFENATAYNLLNSANGDGPTLTTGSAPVFATGAARANKASTGTVLDTSTIGAGRTAIMKQRTLDGLPISMGQTMRLLVGPNLELAARQATVVVQASEIGKANVFAGFVQPVIEPLIQANRWYLFSDPVAAPVYVYGYLNGAEGPQVTTGPVQGADGVEVSVIFDFGVGAIDWRGAWFNPGT